MANEQLMTRRFAKLGELYVTRVEETDGEVTFSRYENDKDDDLTEHEIRFLNEHVPGIKFFIQTTKTITEVIETEPDVIF
jgi:hypothetical protein